MENQLVKINNPLLCTFIKENTIEEMVQIIKNHYTIPNNKIILLRGENSKELFMIYNVFQPENYLAKTILMHRKRATNTLYTINSLNELIKSLNVGQLDKNFKINWDDYKNTLLIIREEQLVIINTLLVNLIKL